MEVRFSGPTGPSVNDVYGKIGVCLLLSLLTAWPSPAELSDGRVRPERLRGSLELWSILA